MDRGLFYWQGGGSVVSIHKTFEIKLAKLVKGSVNLTKKCRIFKIKFEKSHKYVICTINIVTIVNYAGRCVIYNHSVILIRLVII